MGFLKDKKILVTGVASTGSIAWGQALPWNNGDNDVARLTQNVLDRFVGKKPFLD